MRNMLIATGLVFGLAGPALGQSSSVWDGVYSESQAARGAILYRRECVMCHGPVLEGNGEAPPLVGRFIPDWEGTRLTDLFDKIRETMPLSAPATLSPSDTSDVLAFILQSNNFPAGSKDLEAGDALKSINFDAHKPVVKEIKPGKRR